MRGHAAPSPANRDEVDGDGLGDPCNPDANGDGCTKDTGDCRDDNVYVRPNAVEVDDGLDNDWDGSVDEGFDGDGDSYTVIAGGDCNDADATVHPDAEDPVNGIDDNCDGLVDATDPDWFWWYCPPGYARGTAVASPSGSRTPIVV